VFELVEQGKVCVSRNEDSLSFWWNEKKILESLDSLKETEITYSCD